MISGEYTLRCKCDNPNCLHTSEKDYRGKSYSQARMNAIRDNWKITKYKALCPPCRSIGVTVKDLQPGRVGAVKCVKCDAKNQKEIETESCSAGGMHDFRPLPECHRMRKNAVELFSDQPEIVARYVALLRKYNLTYKSNGGTINHAMGNEMSAVPGTAPTIRESGSHSRTRNG